jgi:hypothetical protein
MKSLFIVCAAVACTIAASGCTNGPGGPATSPINPFGTEAAPTTGTEPAGGGGNSQESIAQLCAQVCARISGACGSNDSSCASDCANDAPPGCEEEFRAFLQCIATAMLNCSGGFIAPVCEGALIAADNCASSPPTGMSGGSAGASGSAPPR